MLKSPQRTKKFNQFTNTFCHNTVVIGNEDQRPFIFHTILPYLLFYVFEMHKSSKKNLYRQQNQIGKRRSINIVFTADKKQEWKTSGCYCEEHPDVIRYNMGILLSKTWGCFIS